MKTSHTQRKIAETVVGAAVGAAIGGPVGAVAGGLAGSQVAAHSPRGTESDRTPSPAAQSENDPLVHVQPRRILVPIDFSPASVQTLRFAREWAGRFGSELCLLHVVEPISAVGNFGAEPVAALLPSIDFHAQARKDLEQLARAELGDSVPHSLHIHDGFAWDRIAVAAGELKADLIIIATHGRSGLTHALLGSNAERVVRHAPCPVLTLRRAKD